MLYRFHKLNNRPVDTDTNILNQFVDVSDVASVAAKPLSWAVANGLMTGNGDRINLNEPATRAQVVLMLFRYSKI